MKKIAFIVCLLSCPLLLMGQRTKIIMQKFDISDFSLEKTDEGVVITSHKHDLQYDGLIGNPMLPYIEYRFLISPNEEYGTVTYEASSIGTSHQDMLAPIRPVVPTDGSVTATPRISPQYTQNSYPTAQVEYNGTFEIDGFKYISLFVFPFRYITDKSELYLPNQLSIKLLLKESSAKGAYGKPERTDTSFIKRFVVNPEDFGAIYGSQAKEQTRPSSTTFDYLIITCDSLKDAFIPLALWKKQKGVRSKIMTVEEIYSHYTGRNHQLQIKEAIKDYYETHGTYYVLLGGDVNIVPAQMCYIHYSNYTRTTPADLFYACFNRMDWDRNENNVYGELADSIDFSQQVALTRIPARNSQEVSIMTDRIKCYEKEPITDTWNNNILMSGYFPTDTIPPIHCCAEEKSDLIYNDYIHDYWEGGRFRFFVTGNDFNDGNSHPLTPTNLQERFNKGFCLVDIFAHGGKSRWYLDQQTQYNVAYAESLNNNNHTIILTSACNTNYFDYSGTCLSEAFLRNPNSGVLAYFGCSREGWTNTTPNILGPSNKANALFYKALFSHNHKNYGEIAKKVKEQLTFAYINSYYSIVRWLMLGINPLGDPEMPIYTACPQSLGPVVCTYVNDTLRISHNNGYCKVCVMSKDDDGASFYETQEGIITYTFIAPTSECNVCITKPGYIPYITTVSNNTYIQDETLSGTHNIVSGYVSIGSDVTTGKPSGPVKVQSGSTSIESKDGVYIKNDFEVNLGAVFEIR